MPHAARADVPRRFPVHVTVKLVAGLPSLRKKAEYRALLTAFARACSRPGFRLVHYSVQSNHLHLIVEADGRSQLTAGVRGLLVRVARTLNRLWKRAGSVFADRHHEHVLHTPIEVRNTLCYVLHNVRRHDPHNPAPLDLFTSAPWFDGWREPLTVRNLPAERPVAAADTWLLRAGWRIEGLLGFDEVPGAMRPPRRGRRRGAQRAAV